jgi:hypothetical protein
LVAGASGVLVSADHRAIDVVAQPVQLPTSIGAAVDLGKQPIEDALAPPAVEAAGDRLPASVSSGSVRAMPRNLTTLEPPYPDFADTL